MVSDISLTSGGSGVYTYDYLIAADTPYGQYNVDISTTTHIMVKNYDFYVLPWNLLRDIRRYSGIEDYKSISDEDLAGIAYQSYMEVLDEIYELHFQESPTYDPNVGVMFNGANTTIRTKCGNLADNNGDGLINGFGEQSCGTDVTGFWYDTNYGYNTCKITVVSAISGKLTVTQLDGNPIPSTNKGVYLTYWTSYDTYNLILLREAVAYLAAHKAVKRFGELDRATLIDLESNKAMFLSDRNRLRYLYEIARDKIRRPMFGGGR